MSGLNGAAEPTATPAPEAPPVDGKIDYNDDDRDASYREEAYDVFDKVMARSKDGGDDDEASAKSDDDQTDDSQKAATDDKPVRERDERGRFASKKTDDDEAVKSAESDEEEQVADAEKSAADKTDDDTADKDGVIGLPGTLPKSFTDNWNKMPREAQELFSAREKQMQEKSSAMGRELKETRDDLKLLDPVTKVISKHAETFKAANVNPAQVLELMMARHHGLRDNPVQMLTQLANDYKFDKDDVFDRLVVGSDPAAAISRIANKFNLELIDIALEHVQTDSVKQPPMQQASQPAHQPAPQMDASVQDRIQQLERENAELKQNRSPAPDDGPTEAERALEESVTAFKEQHPDFEALAELIAPTLPGLRDEYPLLEPIQILEIAYDRIKERYVPAGSSQQSTDTTEERLARANAVNVNGSGRRGSSKAPLSEADEINAAWRSTMGT